MKRKAEYICKCQWCVETRSLASELIQQKYGDDDDEDDMIVFKSRK